MGYLIVAILMAIWAGYLAKNRNRNPFGWAVAGLLFGIFAVLIVFLSSKVEQKKK